MINELFNRIEKIFDENGCQINYQKIEIKNEKRKHAINISQVVYIDNLPLSNKQIKSYKVQYLCRCNRHITIVLYKFINKRKLNCKHCLQDKSFDEYSVSYKRKKGIELWETSNYKETDFNKCSEEFKNIYKQKYLSEHEFNEYLQVIERINDINIKDKQVKYIFAAPCKNQKIFVPKISFDNGLHVELIKKIELRCKYCGEIFNIKCSNLSLKDISNIKCKKCGFLSLRYPVKKYKDTFITYQSNLEKKFIDKCYEHNIKIENGLVIPYEFENKIRKYIVDFYLPELKILVEIKASNHFYFNDLKSGKLNAKNNAAIKYCNEHNLTFEFILDDINIFFNNLQL